MYSFAQGSKSVSSSRLLRPDGAGLLVLAVADVEAELRFPVLLPAPFVDCMVEEAEGGREGFVLARRGGGGAPQAVGAGALAMSAALLFLLFSAPPPPIFLFPLLEGGNGVDGPAPLVSSPSSISASSVTAPAEAEAPETDAPRSASMRAICLSRARAASTGRGMHCSQNHCSGRVSGIIGLGTVLYGDSFCREVDSKEGDLDLGFDEGLGLDVGADDCRLDEGD